MEEGEDPLVLLSRAEMAADELAMLGCGKSVEEIHRHIVTNLSLLYTIQSNSILSCPLIPRSEIDDIIRDAYVIDKLEKEMVTKALGIQGGVDPHPLYAGAVPPAGGEGTGSGSEERNKRGGRYKQQQQQQFQQQQQQFQQQQQQFQHQHQQQQQQQHGHRKQNCWDNSGPNTFRTGGQVPAMGWVLPTHRQGICRRCPRRRWEI